MRKRNGCGQAQESGQECDGGVGADLTDF
jgi:hypothetical protein